MLTKKWWQLGLGLLMGLLCVGWAQTSSANSVGFDVLPVTSKYQVDKAVPYFDLKLKPGQETDLSVRIKNTSKQEITVHTTIAPATTTLTVSLSIKPCLMVKILMSLPR